MKLFVVAGRAKEIHMAWIKQSDFNPMHPTNSLVAYAYRTMAKKDPEGFANFVLGGMEGDAYDKEANFIINDFNEGGPWLQDDPEFVRLVDAYMRSQKTNEAEWHKSL